MFDVEGDEAWGETFFVFHGALRTTKVSAWGRYCDFFRRIDRRWRLVYRRVVPDEVPAGDDPAGYWAPSRNRSDPSYDRLRWPPDVPPPR